MQPSRGRSLVASVTSMVLAVTLAWTALADPVAAKPKPHHPAPKPPTLVRAVATATAHDSARRAARVRVQARVRVRVNPIVRPARNGHPAKRASAVAVARASAVGRAVHRVKATVHTRVAARAPTLAKARAKAHARAVALARVRAHANAVRAAKVGARRLARARAAVRAHQRAHDLALLKAWAKLPGHPVLARFPMTFTARASARRTVRFRAHVRVRVRVSAVSKPRRRGKPVGHATVVRAARGRATAHATRRATVRVRVTVVGRAPLPGLAKRLAYSRAVHRATALARRRARVTAHRAAAAAARAKARAHARARALPRARAKATRRAKWLARLDRIDPRDPTTWIAYRPRHLTPSPGAHFNDPYGGERQRRNLLAQVIHAIKSSTGYRLTRDPKTGKRLRCPTNPRYYPSEIKIAVYSIADGRFADAIIAAKRRCVSVQILMNSHLTTTTSRSWGRIVKALGLRSKKTWRKHRNFAHRCSNGCLGTSVLHSKIYLFSHSGHAHDTVITGSSNMTRNATGIQWNDLYTVNNNPRLYSQYSSMFRRMVPDHMRRGPYVFRDGGYTSTFYPFRRATKRTDRTMRDLRTIRCTGARGGTGIGGHTVVYIAMHAWFSNRGGYLAREVRRLYNQGCYVRILYSFLSYSDYHLLTHNTGKRMLVRRVLFSGRDGLTAVKYTHMKMMAVSGHVGSNTHARIVWTGSNNWVDKSLHADEVTLRISSARAYRRYVLHWNLMRHRRSSRHWAIFQEPTGGGRAP